MKRAYSSYVDDGDVEICEPISADDEVVTHPMSSEHTATDLIDTTIDPNSWVILVPDTQNYIASMLDCGTRQCLALTSKRMHERFYRIFPRENPSLFSILVGDAPLVYLERCINVRSYSECYPTYLNSTLKTKRSDIFVILEWLIELYFYNTKYKFVINEKLYSLVPTEFLATCNVQGINWMMTQPWYSEAKIFTQHNIDDVDRALANAGCVEMTNYMYEHVAFFRNAAEENSELKRLVTLNIEVGDHAYPWDVLFSSSDQWRSWWAKWKADDTTNGFVTSVTTMLRSGHSQQHKKIFMNLHRIWPTLDVSIRENLVRNIVFVASMFLTRNASVPEKLLSALEEMGIRVDVSGVANRLFEHDFLDLISYEDSAHYVDWLWKRCDFRRDAIRMCDMTRLLQWIPSWIKKHRKTPYLPRAVSWLNAHPSDVSGIIARAVDLSHYALTGRHLPITIGQDLNL